MKCSVTGCPRASTRKGYCDSHYRRVRRTGSPGGPIPSERPRADPLELFWAKVDKSGDCWLWTGSLGSSGYGHFPERTGTNQVRAWTAHRFAYTHTTGPIPEGLELDHLCRVRNCVNPDHLEPVTRRENMLRGEAPSAIAVRTNRCKRGHEFTPENTVNCPSGRRCRSCQQMRDEARRQRRQDELDRQIRDGLAGWGGDVA